MGLLGQTSRLSFQGYSAWAVEEGFGWLKTIGLVRKLRHRGTERVDWMFVFSTAVYSLARLRTLISGASP